jgi:hypothetical protein
VSQVEAHFDPFRDSVNLGVRLVHDLRKMYHHMEIIFGTPDGTPRRHVSSGSSFGLSRDTVNLSTRWMHGLRLMHHGHGNRFGYT